MPVDYRAKLLNEIEYNLANVATVENIDQISTIITKILNNYEITNRCTDIVTLDDINEKLINRYRGCLYVDGKSQKTIYQYIRTIKLLEAFCRKPFTEMGIYDVRLFLACEKERGLSSRSLENSRANLSAFFQWLTTEELIPKNPLLCLKPIKYTEKIKKPFSDIEIDSMRSACKNEKERALIEFLLATGVRVEELSLMNVDDVNFSTRTVDVKHGKGDKQRLTYITPIAEKYLMLYLSSANRSYNTSLFINRRHERLAPGGIRHILKTIEKRSGVPNIHPHRFRRTFATNGVKNGLTVQEIQRLLGHSNIDTTMKYICMDDTAIKHSYNKAVS